MLRYQRAGKRFAMSFSMKNTTPGPAGSFRPNFPCSGRRLALAGVVTCLLASCSGAGLPGFEQTPAVPGVGNP